MSATLKSLRALSDPTRLRIVALLGRDELSVNELQEITRLGQSRISTHLGLLLDSNLVQSRRDGKRTFYKLNEQASGATGEFIQLAIRGAHELPDHAHDQINLKRVVARRREQAQVYFNRAAGRVLPRATFIAGWKRPASRRLKSASSPPRNSRRIFRRFWRVRKNSPP